MKKEHSDKYTERIQGMQANSNSNGTVRAAAAIIQSTNYKIPKGLPLSIPNRTTSTSSTSISDNANLVVAENNDYDCKIETISDD